MYLRPVALLLKNHLVVITCQLGPLLCSNRIRDCKCRTRSFWYLKNRYLELGCMMENMQKSCLFDVLEESPFQNQVLPVPSPVLNS